MIKNFRCPKCKSLQSMSRNLHGSWTCPKCENTIVPSKEDVDRGFLQPKYKKVKKS